MNQQYVKDIKDMALRIGVPIRSILVWENGDVSLVDGEVPDDKRMVFIQAASEIRNKYERLF